MEKNLLIGFGNRLKKLRKEKGLTQQNMADMMGITMRNYQRYEYGDINVPATTLNFFANYFGVTTDYLLGREQ
jgi:transcriptional regulator with XRE-family HTH domain